MLEMRKRQKMQRLQQNAQPVPQPTAPANPASVVNLTTCDLGASPNLQPKVMKPYRSSPLQNARTTELNKLQKNKGKK